MCGSAHTSIAEPHGGAIWCSLFGMELSVFFAAGSVAASSEQFVAFSSSVTEVGVALVLSLVAIFGRLVVCFL